MGCASAIAVISVNVLTRHTCSSEQRPTTEPTVYGKAGRQKAVRPDQASCVKRPLRRCLPVIFRSPKPRKHSGPATRMHGPLSGVAAGSTSIVDEIDARLARLAGRVQARSAETRALLADAGCLELAEAARETFGAKLVYLRAGDHEQGTEPPQGVPFNFDLRPNQLVAKNRRRDRD